MKQKFLTVKLYLLGLVIGLFMLGWSLIARTDQVQPETAAQTTQATAPQPALARPNRNTTLQQNVPALRPIPSAPRFRTRTS